MSRQEMYKKHAAAETALREKDALTKAAAIAAAEVATDALPQSDSDE